MQSAINRRTRRIVVRRSSIHGKGVFATQAIAPGTRLIEYKGERITSEDDAYLYTESTHTFLFMLDNEEIIDGSRQSQLPAEL